MLGEKAFEHAPAVIKKIHAHLKQLKNERKQAGGMLLQFMQGVYTMSLDKFQEDVLATRTHIRGSMHSWEEWNWDGRYHSCPSAIREPPRELDCELCEGRQEAVDWPCGGTVWDIWSIKLRSLRHQRT